MSSTPATGAAHPLADFATRVNVVLDGLAHVPAWTMTTREEQAALVDLARAQARVEELRLRVLACGDRDDVAADTAATSTAAWLARATRVPPVEAQRDVRLALILDTDLTETRSALAGGALNGDQARVIAAAIRSLPELATTTDPTLAGRAEKHLIGLAADHDARTLERLARHVLEVLDPDAADEALGRRLEAEEEAASAATYLHLHDNGDGSHSGRFKISSLRAVMLRKALEAFTSPAHLRACSAAADPDRATEAAADAVRARLPRPELLGQAFGELIERQDPGTLPTTGGVNATVVVMTDIENLLSGLGTARLDTGEHISAGLARRLACEAGVVPAVVRRLVDGRSVVLDVGRKRRRHTEVQRVALAIEQGGCTAEGCTRPAGWCHAHHEIPWSAGGGTSLTNGRLLCPYHHGKAHSSGYDVRPLPNGRLAFHRRT